MGGAGRAGLLQVSSQDTVAAAGFPSGKRYLSQDSVPWHLEVGVGVGVSRAVLVETGTYDYLMRPGLSSLPSQTLPLPPQAFSPVLMVLLELFPLGGVS